MDPSRDICQPGTQADLPPRPSPAYQVIIEGAERPWHSPTITIAQIRALARWHVRQAVVEVDLETSTETTLTPILREALQDALSAFMCSSGTYPFPV